MINPNHSPHLPVNLCVSFLTNRVVRPVLLAGLGLTLAGQTTAQTFTNLHSFTALGQTFQTNLDGAVPSGDLKASGNTLFRTARLNDGSGNGTVFKLITDGTGFTNLHVFSPQPLALFQPTAMELLRRLDWFYRAAPFTERRLMVVPAAWV